jgi:formaldehyde-activating enzyme involved in methanogenesis
MRTQQYASFSGVLAKLRKATISFLVSVRPSVRPAPIGRIFMKVDIWVFIENLPRKYKFH